MNKLINEISLLRVAASSWIRTSHVKIHVKIKIDLTSRRRRFAQTALFFPRELIPFWRFESARVKPN